MKYNIVTVPGDGIGPDIINEAIKTLNRVGEIYVASTSLAKGYYPDRTESFEVEMEWGMNE